MRQQNCLEQKRNPWLHKGTILRETPSVQSSSRYQEREISTARATLLWEGWWQCWPSSALFCHLFALLRGHSLSYLLRPTLTQSPFSHSQQPPLFLVKKFLPSSIHSLHQVIHPSSQVWAGHAEWTWDYGARVSVCPTSSKQLWPPGNTQCFLTFQAQ